MWGRGTYRPSAGQSVATHSHSKAGSRSGPESERCGHLLDQWPHEGPGAEMPWRWGRYPPLEAPSLCLATVPGTPSASLNGICNRQ